VVPSSKESSGSHKGLSPCDFDLLAGNIDTYYECYTNGDGPYKEFFFAIGRDPDAVSPTSLSFTLFLTLALKAAVPPEMTRYPFYRRLGGPQGRSERESIPGASSP